MRLKCYNQEPLSWTQFSIYTFFFFMSYPFSYWFDWLRFWWAYTLIVHLHVLVRNQEHLFSVNNINTMLNWYERVGQFNIFNEWLVSKMIKCVYNKFETWSWFELKIFNIYLFYLWSEIHYYVKKACAMILFKSKLLDIIYNKMRCDKY